VKFAWLSANESGLALAKHLAEQGNVVVSWNRSQSLRTVLSSVDNTAIIVFGSSGGGITASRLAKQGFNVIGSSRLADSLISDRLFAFKLLASVGISVPNTFRLETAEQAKQFLRQSDRNFILQPVKGYGKLASPLATKSRNELIAAISLVQNDLSYNNAAFVLQEQLEGVSVNTEGWFDGHSWVPPFIHSIDGVVWACQSNRLIASTLFRLTPLLRERYVGPLSLDCKVQERLVVTRLFPGISYDTIYAWLELLKTPFGEFLNGIAKRKYSELPVLMDEVAISCRVLHEGYVTGNQLNAELFATQCRPSMWPLSCDSFMLSSRGKNVAAARASLFNLLWHLRSSELALNPFVGQQFERSVHKLERWLQPVDSANYPASLSGRMARASLDGQSSQAESTTASGEPRYAFHPEIRLDAETDDMAVSPSSGTELRLDEPK
jgi:hypothetical protein